MLASQVVSNVPAAVLLSGFSQNRRALLTGTNLGGLGTPIASLASLISLKLYARSAPGGTRRLGRHSRSVTAAKPAPEAGRTAG